MQKETGESIGLSKDKISSFAGNIVTLNLISSTRDLTNDAIKWEITDPDLGKIREFSGDEADCFSDGILILLLKEGRAKVRAILDDLAYECELQVKEAQKAKPGDSYQHYFGDFHAHTTTKHDVLEFKNRLNETAEDMLHLVKADGVFSSYAISDHASIVDKKEFFQAFLAAETSETADFIPFAGVESETDIDWIDHYNLANRSSGEVVTFNALGYGNAESWDEFFDLVKPHHYSVGSLAHPQILGYSLDAMWNFDLTNKSSPQLRELVHLCEMGNGLDKNSNLINERIYSVALDCGFKIGPASTSDSHGPVWGSGSHPGRTVVLSPGLSRDLFLDALVNARVYASESGNVKIEYTVNGFGPAATLPLSDDYLFEIQLTPFAQPARKITRVELVSDYGKVVTSCQSYSESVDITLKLKSDSARYFYLRIFDEVGDRAWSAPVWTGRAFDKYPLPELKADRLTKEHWTIRTSSGENPEKLISGDPRRPWTANSTDADILIDLGEKKTLCALGYYPHLVARDEPELFARFINDFTCYASSDGNFFSQVATGIMRAFGGEQIVRFAPVCARYFRLYVKDTVGKVSCKKHYLNEPLMIGEIDLYTPRNE